MGWEFFFAIFGIIQNFQLSNFPRRFFVKIFSGSYFCCTVIAGKKLFFRCNASIFCVYHNTKPRNQPVNFKNVFQFLNVYGKFNLEMLSNFSVAIMKPKTSTLCFNKTPVKKYYFISNDKIIP